MSRINVRGQITAADVTVTRGELTATDTGDLAAAVQSNATYAGFLQASYQARVAEPISFTISNSHNGFANGYAPVLYSNYSTVLSVDGRKLRIEGLNRSDSFNPAMYLAAGGEIEVFRVASRDMDRVRKSAISDANFSVGGRLFGNQMIVGTTYNYQFNDWERPGVPYWFAVAAVDATGKLGALSSWVSYTPANVTTGDPSDTPTDQAISSTAGALAAPTGVAVEADGSGPRTAVITWNSVATAIGYMIYKAYTDPATWPADDYLELADDGGATVLPGDMVIWRVPITRLDRDMICNRIYGTSEWLNYLPSALYTDVFTDRLYTAGALNQWEIKPWSVEVPKPDPSLQDYYLERIAKPGSTWDDGTFWSGGSGQTYYYVKQPGDDFRVDAWVWASEARAATFSSGQPSEPNQDWTLPTVWTEKNFSSTFTSAPTGTQAYRWRLGASPGASDLVVRIAGMKAYLGQDVGFGELKPVLAGSMAPGMLARNHSLIKTRPATYDAAQIVGARGEACRSLPTIPMHLDVCAANSVKPWTQVEWSLSKEGHILVAECLAANAYRFSEMHHELGNENWQSGSIPEFWGPFPSMTDSVTATVYSGAQVEGLYLKMVYGWMQEADGWEDLEPKLHMHICGQSVSSYGENAYREFPEAKHVDGAYYIEGWDTGTTKKPVEDGETFAGMLGFSQTFTKQYIVARIAGLQDAAADVDKVYGADVVPDWYEGAPGYQLNGLNGASMGAADYIVQEVVKKSRGSATSMADHLFMAQYYGQRPNFFVLQTGDRWSSHREDGTEFLTWTVGKTLAERLGSYRIHPITTINNETVTINGASLPKVAAYGLQSVADPSHWIIAVLNRRMDYSVLETDDDLYDAGDTGIASCLIRTAVQSATGCAVFTAGIGNPREHNRYAEGTRLNASGSYDADALCVEFDTSWTTVDVPANVGAIVIDDDLGASVGGLRGGNFLMVELTGVA